MIKANVCSKESDGRMKRKSEVKVCPREQDDQSKSLLKKMDGRTRRMIEVSFEGALFWA